MKIYDLVNRFKLKITDPKFLPSSPEETMQARAAAVLLLNDPDFKAAASEFLKRSSVDSLDKEAEIKRLQALADNIKKFESLEILSRYKKTGDRYCEYRFIYYNKDDELKTIHQHAKFIEHDKGWQFVSQEPQIVRVVGDPILHVKPMDFPIEHTASELERLKKQIDEAKRILIATAGGGIAANQCLMDSPYNFAIVGVFNDLPEHYDGVAKRYPGAKFPDARVMINPQILFKATESETFKHGCLSMPSNLRGIIESPLEIKVLFWTLEDDKLVKKEEAYKHAENIGPIVLHHELSHILLGYMFFDYCLKGLESSKLEEVYKILQAEADKRSGLVYHELTFPTEPYLVFDGKGGFDSDALQKALKQSTDYVLDGMITRVKHHLEEKPTAKTMFYKHPEGSSVAKGDEATSGVSMKP